MRAIIFWVLFKASKKALTFKPTQYLLLSYFILTKTVQSFPVPYSLSNTLHFGFRTPWVASITYQSCCFPVQTKMSILYSYMGIDTLRCWNYKQEKHCLDISKHWEILKLLIHLYFYRRWKHPPKNFFDC